ncbi:hypothetical protein [Photorhabdus khanii]|uniref:hypothetical protein n=1 Tax=Photorhabdus khanii TaxID=1004150 RepID=UPI0009DCD1E8
MFLNAISNVLDWDIPKQPTFLWTLPMFHCNGWCFPWAITARGGTHICMRKKRYGSGGIHQFLSILIFLFEIYPIILW